MAIQMTRDLDLIQCQNSDLDFCRLFRIENSEWIDKLNKRRPKTTWDLFAGYQHCIVTFKDITIDIVSKGFKEVTLTVDEVIELTKKEINNLIVD